MKRAYSFVLLVLIPLILVFQIVATEIPDIDQTYQNGNELIYLKQNIPLLFEFNNKENLSSIELNCSLYKDSEMLFKTLFIDINKKDGKKELNKSIEIPFINLFFKNSIKIPLDSVTSDDNSILLISVKTNAPDNALAIYSHANIYNLEDTRANPNHLDYVGYRKRNPLLHSPNLKEIGIRLSKIFFCFLLIYSIGLVVLSIIDWKSDLGYKGKYFAIYIGLASLPILGLVTFYLDDLDENLSKALVFVLILFSLIKTYKLRHLKPQGPKIEYIKIFQLLILFLLPLLISIIFNSFNQVAPWVDGIKHQEIISSLIGHSRDPFLSGYHIGFHLIAYLLSKINIIENYQLSFYLGQLIYSLSALSMFLFLKGINIQERISFLASIIFSLCLPFPLYLLNWSRYPLLLSIVLLLPLLALLYNWIEGNKKLLPLILALIPGLALSHYGSIFLLTTFIFADLFIQKKCNLINLIKKDVWKQNNFIFSIVLIFLTYIIISVSKGIGFSNLIGQQFIETQDPFSDIGLLLKGFGRIFILLACIGWIINTKKRERFSILDAWIVMIGLGSLVQLILFSVLLFNLRNLIVFGSIYIAIYSAYILNELIKSIEGFPKIHYLTEIFAIIFGLFSIINCKSIISPSLIQVSREDLLACDWINNYMGIGDTFIINSFRWGNELVPLDGGGWITPITGRESILIPYSTNDEELCNYISSNPGIFYYAGFDRENTQIHNLKCITKIPLYQDHTDIFLLK